MVDQNLTLDPLSHEVTNPNSKKSNCDYLHDKIEFAKPQFYKLQSVEVRVSKKLL